MVFAFAYLSFSHRWPTVGLEEQLKSMTCQYPRNVFQETENGWSNILLIQICPLIKSFLIFWIYLKIMFCDEPDCGNCGGTTRSFTNWGNLWLRRDPTFVCWGQFSLFHTFPFSLNVCQKQILTFVRRKTFFISHFLFLFNV